MELKLDNTMKGKQLEDWRNRLNKLHDELERDVEVAWNKIIEEDNGCGFEFAEKVEEKEMIRRGRHIVNLLESCIDNLDLMRKTFNN